MADLDHIKDDDNDITYNIKDATARDDIATLSGELDNKMDKVNPTGSGAFSLNRLANSVVGVNSFAEGYQTVASGEHSHAEGSQSEATGNFSHSEGLATVASNYAAHAEGASTVASGNRSHAEGADTVASAYAAHAEGNYTIAASRYQHVSGTFNVADSGAQYAEIIGNGSDDNNRSNARTLDWQGNETIAGDLYFNGGSDSLSVQLGDKQDTLVSGTNIKTVNGTSLLGADNIVTPDTKPGSVTSNNGTNTLTVANNQWVDVATLSMTAGKLYLVSCCCVYPSDATGQRGVGIRDNNNTPVGYIFATNVGAGTGGEIIVTWTGFFVPVSGQTYVMITRQSSGSTINNVKWRYRFVPLN